MSHPPAPPITKTTDIAGGRAHDNVILYGVITTVDQRGFVMEDLFGAARIRSDTIGFGDDSVGEMILVRGMVSRDSAGKVVVLSDFEWLD